MEAVKQEQQSQPQKLTREDAERMIFELTHEKAFGLIESIIEQNIKSGNFNSINDVLVISAALDRLKTGPQVYDVKAGK